MWVVEWATRRGREGAMEKMQGIQKQTTYFIISWRNLQYPAYIKFLTFNVWNAILDSI